MLIENIEEIAQAYVEIYSAFDGAICERYFGETSEFLREEIRNASLFTLELFINRKYKDEV